MNGSEFARINRTIAAESGKLFPIVERIAGAENRADFRESFDNVAGRFARGLYSLAEFQGITGELVRDASGTVAGQDRAAEARDSGMRKPWATMPTDGSSRLQLIDRVILGAVVVAVLIALGWVAGLLIEQAQREDARTAPVSVSTVERDRELIIQGGAMSWAAFTECGNGPAACAAILRELNANPYGVRVFEDGSLIEVERTEDTFKVTMSGPTYGN